MKSARAQRLRRTRRRGRLARDHVRVAPRCHRVRHRRRVLAGHARTVSNAPPTRPRSRARSRSPATRAVQRAGAGRRRQQRLHGRLGQPARRGAAAARCTRQHDDRVRRPGDRAYQYKVTVAQKVNNFFGGIFGIGTTTVRATAQAEYLEAAARWAARRTSSATIPTRPPGRSTTAPAADVPELLGQHQRRRHREAARRRVRGQLVRQHERQLVTDGCSGDRRRQEHQLHAATATTTPSTSPARAPRTSRCSTPRSCNVGQFCTPASNANLAGAAATRRTFPAYPQGANNTADIQKRFRPVDQRDQPGRSRLPVLHRRQHVPQQRGQHRRARHDVHRAEGDRSRRTPRARRRCARRSRTPATTATSRRRSRRHDTPGRTSRRTSASGRRCAR